ncbi:MAG: hypothetical protein H7Y11_01625 [Armatimonadetes bacterium]|nr:hypothetical protein [Anaerolineae bacterium]
MNPDDSSLMPDDALPELPSTIRRTRKRVVAVGYGDYDEERDWEDDATPPYIRLLQRVLFVLLTLLIVFAILATSILPGLLATERNEYLRELPPATTMPRI